MSLHRAITKVSMCFAVASALLLTSCSSMYRKQDEVAVKKVKTAAVIAFIVKEPASKHIGLDLNTGKTGSKIGGSSFYLQSEKTTEIYDDFVKALAKATKWKVLPRHAIVQNIIYEDERKKLMAPVQIMFLPPSGENWSLARDVMVPKAAETGGRDARTKILNALNVDAVVVAEVKVSVKGGFSLGSLGPRRPQARFDMQIYERDNADPIWLEGGQGDKSEESLGWTGFMNEERLSELTQKSVRSAFAKIGQEIK